MKSFTELPDLANERLGSRVLFANDEFFAPKENLIKPGEAVWLDDEYTDRGKWMDGWETRRRRGPGHDWVLIELGASGEVHGVVIDTTHFRGNYPESCSLEGCSVPADTDLDTLLDQSETSPVAWRQLLPQTMLDGNARNQFEVERCGRITHVRLNIHPDGGLARLRVHGQVSPDWQRLDIAGEPIDLAAIEFGGRSLLCNDESMGRASNLLMPGAARNIADGWQTRRRTQDGDDWTIVALGVPGSIETAIVDTSYFIGNAPTGCTLEACAIEDGEDALARLTSDACPWRDLLPRTALKANREQVFDDELAPLGPVTHVRFTIHPDGGVARLRLFGVTVKAAAFTRGLAALNQLSETRAKTALADCFAATSWVAAMSAARPFAAVRAVFDHADATWDRLAEDGEGTPVNERKATHKRLQALLLQLAEPAATA